MGDRLSLKPFAVIVVSLLVSSEAFTTTPSSCVLRFEGGSPLRNCRDVQTQLGHNTNGVYTIFPYKCCPQLPLKVFCDMETDGGGWTVIQRRDDIEPREDFYRTWMEYALGFGSLKGEFWLGNDNLHELTDQTFNEIRFDLEDFEGNVRWAIYRFFYVHNRGLSFKMEVNGYSGDAGDAFGYHGGQSFSAKDKELDIHETANCANNHKSGWWYKSCHLSNLNGLYLSGNHTSYADGINWQRWHGYHYSLKKTEMKIRPSFN